MKNFINTIRAGVGWGLVIVLIMIGARAISTAIAEMNDVQAFAFLYLPLGISAGAIIIAAFVTRHDRDKSG